MNFAEALRAGLNAFGIQLSSRAEELLVTHHRLLVEADRNINLTGIHEPAAMALRHYVDGLAVLRWCIFRAEERLLDIGSGAGFPGLLLALVQPEIRVVLLEASGKKAAFLKRAVASLGVGNCTVLWGRAEEYGQRREYREGFHWVVARAVAVLPELVEYALPFLRIGGTFVAYKGPRGEAEVEEAAKALELLGGKVREVCHYRLPLGQERRIMIFVQKERPTPPGYPRRAGIPHKRPVKA